MNIYKIQDVETGKYYIGMNRTNDEDYYGSGTWIKKQAKIFSNLNRLPNSAKSYHFKSTPDRFLKTILFTTENVDELYYMEKELIGNLWKEDKNCMNKMCGGYSPPNYKGREHPRYDHNLIHLFNINLKREMFITQNDFNNTFSNGNDSIRKILKNGQYKGWVLFSNKDKEYGKNKSGESSNNFDDKQYTFINLYTLKVFMGNRTNFKIKYTNLNSKSVDSIINGFNKIYNGWCLIENVNSITKTSNFEKYEFVKNNEISLVLERTFLFYMI